MDRGLTSAQATAILRNVREIQRKRKRQKECVKEEERERVPERLLCTVCLAVKRTVYSQWRQMHLSAAVVFFSFAPFLLMWVFFTTNWGNVPLRYF